MRRWQGRAWSMNWRPRGILIRSPSSRRRRRGAPLAYKDVGAVVDAWDQAGLAGKWRVFAAGLRQGVILACHSHR